MFDIYFMIEIDTIYFVLKYVRNFDNSKIPSILLR